MRIAAQCSTITRYTIAGHILPISLPFVNRFNLDELPNACNNTFPPLEGCIIAQLLQKELIRLLFFEYLLLTFFFGIKFISVKKKGRKILNTNSARIFLFFRFFSFFIYINALLTLARYFCGLRRHV